jgi:DNA-directed RNA polymerase specialized sigma24 family protein
MSTSIQRESESIINKYFSAVGTVCDSMKKKERKRSGMARADITVTTLKREDLQKLIDVAAEAAASKTLRKLKDAGRINRSISNSFKKTEDLLYLYPKLPADHPERQRIEAALAKIKDDEYKDVIASRYFDCMSITEISEIYDCKYQTISKKRNKLVKILASELFPEDVLKEILQK